MTAAPREITTPFRPIPLEVPEGMKPNEFFNSADNLKDLVHNNGLLETPEHLLLRRVPHAAAYGKAEPALVEQLLEVRRRLIAGDLGKGIATAGRGA